MKLSSCLIIHNPFNIFRNFIEINRLKMEVSVSENKENKRFEVMVDGKLAMIEYIKAQNIIYLTHTEVPPELGGRGIASAMVEQVFQQIKQEGLELVPLCPFVAAYLKRHPEWIGILAKGYNV